MNTRSWLWVAASAGALAACGGRAALSEYGEAAGACTFDCEPPSPNAGATARGGASTTARGGAGPGNAGSVAGADGGAAPSAGDAGSIGETEAGGAPPESSGGTGTIGAGGSHAGGACASSPGRFASEVLSHAFGGGQNFNQATGFPDAIFGPPAAGETSSVVSLGNGGWVVLGFSGNAIVDGPGVDFTVFENPLPMFKELATVAVSDDAQHWTEFPCTAAQDSENYGFCAGVGVVYSSPSNGIDPLDPAVSGGDPYDLADIGVAHARFVRITDRADLQGMAGVFDLDALAIVHAECP